MKDTENLQLFAVAGLPISHSLSPKMMNRAMKVNDFHGYYMYLAADSVDEILSVMTFLEMSGCNITAPFKMSVLEKIDNYDTRVQQTGSVNLIVWQGDEWVGFNTDVNGVYQSLKEYKSDFQACSVLIIGYGGAAHAAAYACKMMEMQKCVTGNDPEKAAEFANKTGCIPIDIEKIQKAVDQSDVIISTIPKNTQLLNQVTFGEQQIVLDCDYSNTGLENKVVSRNAFYISGKKWLLYQGCPAYKIFTSYDAPVEEMEQAVQEENTPPKIFSIIAVSEGLLQTVTAHLTGFEHGVFMDLTEDACLCRKLKKRIRKAKQSYAIVMATTEHLEDDDYHDFIKNETFCFFLVSGKEKEKEKTLQNIRAVDVLVPTEMKTGAQIGGRIKKEIENICTL
jgi:shikimate dehydrogenase